MSPLVRTLVLSLLAAVFASVPVAVRAQQEKIGVVIMHGKGGSPARHVSGLAKALEGQDYLVANLDMPWSGRREYDVNVSRAEEEVESALQKLRSQGARKVFVAGHSQGGVFALHLAGKLALDGVIAISPGGDVGNMVFREKLGVSVARARQLIAEGKGEEKTVLEDYEGSKGTNTVTTTPAVYMTWFDHEGAMNSARAARSVKPKTPILWIVAKNDYPGLRRTNIPMFNTFPAHPHNKLYEPDSDHLGTPAASADEIVRWTKAIASGPKP